MGFVSPTDYFDPNDTNITAFRVSRNRSYSFFNSFKIWKRTSKLSVSLRGFCMLKPLATTSIWKMSPYFKIRRFYWHFCSKGIISRQLPRNTMQTETCPEGKDPFLLLKPHCVYVAYGGPWWHSLRLQQVQLPKQRGSWKLRYLFTVIVKPLRFLLLRWRLFESSLQHKHLT